MSKKKSVKIQSMGLFKFKKSIDVFGIFFLDSMVCMPS